jgi:choice-of-anchor A domain-containing protein
MRKITIGTLLGTVGIGVANSASAALVGAAADYNVFIFGNGSFMSTNTDTMGDLAAGGSVTLMNYTVAQGIAGNSAINPNPARLVVGGQLTAQNGGVGSNQQGAIYYGTLAPNIVNHSFTAGGGQFANQSLVDFAAAGGLYTSYSSQLGGLTANGSATFNGTNGELDFTGTNAALNVFTISNTLLTSSKGIDITAPTGSTVLINVTGGGTATFSNGSVVENGVTGAAVLYNFVGATGLQLSPTGTGGKDPEGSILAPLAAVSGGFAAMSGQLVAASYSGNTQFNNIAFTGTLPNPVPLPGAAILFSSGLLAMVRFVRRRHA